MVGVIVACYSKFEIALGAKAWFDLSKMPIAKNRDSLSTNGDSLQRLALGSTTAMLYNNCW
jgi:hypothetical protein